MNGCLKWHLDMEKCLERIDEIEEIEKVIIQDTMLKRFCTASLGLLKAVLECSKYPRKVRTINKQVKAASIMG